MSSVSSRSFLSWPVAELQLRLGGLARSVHPGHLQRQRIVGAGARGVGQHHARLDPVL